MNDTIIKTEFSCKRDALTIRGYEYRIEGDNLPIAIVSHGFMANLGTVKHYARLLASLGYAAFCFDFCGGCVTLGKSDGRTTEMSVFTEVEDLLSVIEYAKGLSYTDASRITLMGCSQGGFVSAITASRLKDEVEDLILFFPALCIPDDARRGQLMMAKFDPNNVPEIFRCGPMKLGRRYATDVLNLDPFELIKDHCGDVMIVHGTADRIVDIDYSRRAKSVYEARSCGSSVIMHEIEGAGHIFSKKHDRTALEILRLYIESNLN